jgi:antirestriction protein ArdC
MSNNLSYDRVTERILDLMNSGLCPWRQPWSTKLEPPQNFATHRHYSGMNFFMLSMSGYQSPYFMTFRQIQEHGGSVRKGSHGFPVIYWGTTETEAKDAPGESTEVPAGDASNTPKNKLIPFLRSYHVFNAEQIEGIKFPAVENAGDNRFDPIARAEEIIGNWKDGPETLHGYSAAYYRPSEDKIFLPHPQTFASPIDYYATRFHEMGHATGAPKRLDRGFSSHFGSQEYSREELVAEMTSAFLCSKCGIDNNVIRNQAAYLKGWMKAISDDHRLIVMAAGQAQRAANYIQGITHEVPTKDRAEALARTMKVREKVREIAKGMRPDYGKEERQPVQMELVR